MASLIVVEKIWAIGCHKRFMYVVIQHPHMDKAEYYWVPISDKLYRRLKESYVPTAQSLRYKK